MDNIELNPLNEKMRKLLQLGVILIVTIFLFGFFFVKDKEKKISQKTVYLQDKTLYFFDESIEFNGFPERTFVHYPYLLLVKPQKQESYIYNLKTRKLEKKINKIVLDYYGGKVLYNKGSSTVYDKTTLNRFCEKGIIKSKNEIVCLPAGEQNKLLLISLTNKENKQLYKTHNAITEIALIDNKIYIGEINMTNGKNYLAIDEKSIEVPNIVSLIYQMETNIYIGSFRSPLNKNVDSYYEVDKNKITKKAGQKILILIDE